MRTTYQNTSMRFGFFRACAFRAKNPECYGFFWQCKWYNKKPRFFWILVFANVNGPNDSGSYMYTYLSFTKRTCVNMTIKQVFEV